MQFRLEVVFVWDVCLGQLSCRPHQEVERRRPSGPRCLPEAGHCIRRPAVLGDLAQCSPFSGLGYRFASPGSMAASVYLVASAWSEFFQIFLNLK